MAGIIQKLSVLAQLTVEDRDLSAPPGSPAEEDTYIVATGGSGLWSGLDDAIVQYEDGAWVSYAPQEGWRCYLKDEDITVVWSGSAWVQTGDIPAPADPGDDDKVLTASGGGTSWVSPAVASVNTETGAVVLDADDISDAATTNKFTTAADITKLSGIENSATQDQSAAEVAFTPAGDVVATDVQAAIEELDTEKLALAGGTMSGDIDLDNNHLVNLRTGTFTPAFDFVTTGDLSVSYTSQSGFYIRVGEMVWVEITVNASSLTYGTASGNVLITGLPFAATANINDVAIVNISNDWSWGAGYTQVIVVTAAASSSMKIRGIGSAKNSKFFGTTELSSGTSPFILFGGWYRTDDA